MASFVESATLKVNDQSTAKINKINASLKKLFATARSLKSSTINIRVNDQGLQRATTNVKQLHAALRGLRSTTISLRVNETGLSKARRDLNALRASARAPINVNVRHAPGTAGGRVPRQPVPVTPAARAAGARPRHLGGTAGGAAIRGAAAGAGIPGVGVLQQNFGLLAAAAYGAAAALNKVAEAGMARSRTEGQTQAMTTPEMRDVYSKLPPSHINLETGKPTASPLPPNLFTQIRNEIAGDVAAQTKDGQVDLAQTAKNADRLTRHIQENVVPGLRLRNPTMTDQQIVDKMKYIIKGGGMATSEMFTPTGEISPDYKRYEAGVLTGLRINPEIPMNQVKSTVAGMKTAAYQLDPDAMARSIVIAGDRGPLIGNQLFQFQQSMRGIVKNNALNNALADRGVIQNPKRDAKGNVKPGTGTIRRGDLLGRNPYEFAVKEFGEEVKKYLETPEVKARVEKEVAGGKDEDVAKQSEAVDKLSRILPSMPKNTLQFMSEAILGNPAWQRQAGLAAVVSDPEKDRAIAEANPAQKLLQLGQAAEAAAGTLGEMALSVKPVGDFMTGMTKMLRGDTTTPDEKGAVTFAASITAAIAGIGIKVATALATPFTSLTTAGTGLSAAAAELTAAAAALSKGAIGDMVPGPDGKPTKGGPPKRAGMLQGIKTATATALPYIASWAAPILAAGGAVYAASKVSEVVGAAKDNPVGWYQSAVAAAKNDIAMAQRSKIGASPEERAGLDQQIAELNANIAKYSQVIADKTQEPFGEAVPTVPTMPSPSLVPEPAKAAPWGDLTKPLPVNIVDKASVAGVPADAASPLAPAFLQVSSSLETTAASFPAVFSTGGATIGTAITNSTATAGATIGGAITSGTASAGASLQSALISGGAAAAAAIQAAVSNINVNVNVKGGGADTGSSKAAEK